MIRTADRASMLAAPGFSLSRGMRAALGRAALMLRLAAERRALARLDAARLADLGIDPEAARAEAARPFWDAPAGRA
ncbi:hypothetical protein [Oceanicella actignis]|uniref:hypothetical protein n=1 Tax=Oceanicella actignis TaxID=1189325 RepID=UPI0011E787D3|nr:hypothetical protein [Oceanicella actignis]TYO89582.1 hypothetical protein LY05_01571 [Oceanicella actignis]